MKATIKLFVLFCCYYVGRPHGSLSISFPSGEIRVVLIVSTCIPECYRNFNATNGKNDYREIPSPHHRIRIAYEFIMAIRGSLRIAGAKISTNVRIHDTESYKLPDGFRYPWDFPTILSWSLRNFSLKWHSEVFYYIRQPRRAIQVYI